MRLPKARLGDLYVTALDLEDGTLRDYPMRAGKVFSRPGQDGTFAWTYDCFYALPEDEYIRWGLYGDEVAKVDSIVGCS